jgi:hypothetical protein
VIVHRQQAGSYRIAMNEISGTKKPRIKRGFFLVWLLLPEN